MTNKVDIRSLYQLPLENLQLNKLTEQESKTCFENTDLRYDYEKEILNRISQDAGEDRLLTRTTLQKEVRRIQLIRAADVKDENGKGDGWLDYHEAKNLIGGHNPTKFLEGFAPIIKNRYEPLIHCLKKLDSLGPNRPLMDMLRTYNEGILEDDVRHAHAVLPKNGLKKSAFNILSFPLAAIHNIFTSDENDWEYLKGTARVIKTAKEDYKRADQALKNLEAVLLVGFAKDETWAKSRDLDTALKQLSPEDQAIITQRLAGRKINKILLIEEPSERLEALKVFAKAERPESWGYGGGNTRQVSEWNSSGRRNNIYFARSIFHYLSKKASVGPLTGDNEKDKKIREANIQMQTDARSQLSEIQGNGGSFTNALVVAATQVFSLGGRLFEPTPYREWSDFDAMNGVGRFINGVLLLRGAGLGRKIYIKSTMPGPIGNIRQMAEGTIIYSAYRFFRKAPSPSKVFLKAPTSNSRLVNGIIKLAIIHYGDEWITGPTTPYEMGFDQNAQRQLNLNPPKLLSEFDPQVYQGQVPQYDPDRFEEKQSSQR